MWKNVIEKEILNRMWSGDGPPGIEEQLLPVRGLVVNVPIGGGVGLILGDTDETGNNLFDGAYNAPASYISEGNTVFIQALADGTSPAIQLSRNKLIGSLKLYVAGRPSSNLNINVFNIITSIDGISWTINSTISHPSTKVIFTKDLFYGVITIKLATPIVGKYIAIRCLNNLTVTEVDNNYIHELEVFSPDFNFGVPDDEYRDNLTGKIYKNINGEWVLAYTPPEVPLHLVGDENELPDTEGLPIGSLFFIRSEPTEP